MFHLLPRSRPNPDASLARCRRCGFLAYRPKDSGVVTEITREMRDLRLYGERPFPVAFCLRGVDLRTDADQFGGGGTGLKKAIERDRDCLYFIDHQEGLSPKELLELEQRQLVEDKSVNRARFDRRWGLLVLVLGAILSGVLAPIIRHFFFPDR